MDVWIISDKMPSSEIGLHYPYNIHTLQVEKRLRKPKFSVMGPVNLFALLELLLPRL